MPRVATGRAAIGVRAILQAGRDAGIRRRRRRWGVDEGVVARQVIADGAGPLAERGIGETGTLERLPPGGVETPEGELHQFLVGRSGHQGGINSGGLGKPLRTGDGAGGPPLLPSGSSRCRPARRRPLPPRRRQRPSRRTRTKARRSFGVSTPTASRRRRTSSSRATRPSGDGSSAGATVPGHRLLAGPSAPPARASLPPEPLRDLEDPRAHLAGGLPARGGPPDGKEGLLGEVLRRGPVAAGQSVEKRASPGGCRGHRALRTPPGRRPSPGPSSAGPDRGRLRQPRGSHSLEAHRARPGSLVGVPGGFSRGGGRDERPGDGEIHGLGPERDHRWWMGS